jgi:hypothetical protein
MNCEAMDEFIVQREEDLEGILLALVRRESLRLGDASLESGASAWNGT